MNDFYDGEEVVEEKSVNNKSKESENDIPVRWKEATTQMDYGIDVLGYESLLDYGHSQNDDDVILELLNNWNVPTKLITLTYNNETIQYYE